MKASLPCRAGLIVLALVNLLTLHSCTAFKWSHNGAAVPKSISSPADSSKETHSNHPRSQPNRSRLGKFFEDLVTGNARKPSSRSLQHLLYWITAADAIHSVFLNEYSGIYLKFCTPIPVEKTALVPSVYSKLFYFARLRPRLLYSIGALVRALQLCTPFRRVLDPTVGVGAGVNLCALLAGSRWVKPFVLGWATTKWLWTWLGARQVERAYLPITLSIHEWEDKKAQKKRSTKTEGSGG